MVLKLLKLLGNFSLEMDSQEQAPLMLQLEKWVYQFVSTTKEHSDSCRNMLKISDLFTLKTLTLHLTIILMSLGLLGVVNLFYWKLWLLEVNHTDGEIYNFKFFKHEKPKEVLAK